MPCYRPIADVWILARPKVKYHGAYPSGFLHRARQLLGVSNDDAVLHVCSGKVRDYPYRGFGPNDWTCDSIPDPTVEQHLGTHITADVAMDGVPDYPFPAGWPAILMDPPYTAEDAAHYATSATLPEPGPLVRSALQAVRPGGRVGLLHYQVPKPPHDALFVALVAVWCGYGGRMRAYSVFERGV